MEDEYLSAKEFASRVKMHYNSIIRSIRKGRIIAVKLGSGKKAAYRIPLSEVNRLGVVDLEGLIQRMVEEKMMKKTTGK